MPWIDRTGKQCKKPIDCHSFDPQVDVLDDVRRVPAVEFIFDNYNDGKPFSWSTKLRKKGYQGAVVAGGDLGIDRSFYAFRCGFSLVWLSDEDYTQLSAIHLQPFSHHYQPAVGDQL